MAIRARPERSPARLSHLAVRPTAVLRPGSARDIVEIMTPGQGIFG